MIESSEVVHNTNSNSGPGPLSSELLYVERLIGDQDVDSARRIIAGLRVAMDKSGLEAVNTKAMIELLDVETRAILGLSIANNIAILKSMNTHDFSEVIQSRVHVVEFMALVATRRMHQLADYVSSGGVDSTLVALEESYSKSGIMNPEIALAANSPLARTLYQHCLLVEPSGAGAQSAEKTSYKLQVAKASLGSRIPPSSMLPVMIWRMELAASKRSWVLGLVDRELGGQDFPAESYGRLVSKACDAIYLASEEDFAEAKSALSVTFDGALLEDSLLRDVYVAKMKCALGLGNLAEAVEMIESVIRPSPSDTGGSTWSEDQLTRLIEVFLLGVKPSKAGCGTLNRLARNLILNFGEGSLVVQQLRMHAAMMAMEIGEITECASILSDFESALGMGGVDYGASIHSGHQELAKFLNSLSLWTYDFVVASGNDVSDFVFLGGLSGGWYERSVHDLRNGNVISANHVSGAERITLTPADIDTGSTSLSGIRVKLLIELNEYTGYPSIVSFDHLRTFVQTINNAFLPGLCDNLLSLSVLAAEMNMPDFSTEIEDRISKTLNSENRSVSGRLAIRLGKAAEFRKAFRVAALRYDRLLKDDCLWLDSSGSLESYTRYRSAYAWAMNFNYDKAIWRARDTLRLLDGHLGTAETVELLDLAARSCEHLGDRSQALDLLGRALSMHQPENDKGRKLTASLSLRAGRLAEEMAMMDVALDCYRAGIQSLVSITSLEDDDLIVLKARANSVAITLQMATSEYSTFSVCKRTLDSPS